ncbi:MAG TPA: lysylphosphatidylglycerol synthase transmembrane domain-containing protein [Terriglobia bacterium]|nr:lysylphosphatidylglycerol synthase transmembrane domain-containing protein [Terriglobia bacterium]
MDSNDEAVRPAGGASILGYVVAGLALIWVFHDVHPGAALRSVASLDPLLLAAAIAVDILSYVCQGFRWTLLLHRRISVLRATQAIYSGLFLNEVFPMRVGELVRGYIVSRWLATDFTSILPSIVVERTFDAVWLAIGIGLTALFVPVPRNLLMVGDILGVTVLAATAALFYVVFHKRDKAATRRNRGRIGTFIETFVLGTRLIGRSRLFYAAFILSSAYLTTQILSFWLVMRAYGLDLNIWAGAATLLIIHVGTAIPNAPANVGTYQFFCVLGLTLFGIDKSSAAGFSVVVFIALTIPLWIVGFLGLSRSGMTTRNIGRHIRRLADQQDRPDRGRSSGL